MSAYSTAYHTIKFTINTVDEDGFVKSIDGENFVQIDPPTLTAHGTRNARRKTYIYARYCRPASIASVIAKCSALS